MPNSRQSRVYMRSQSANTLFCQSGIRWMGLDQKPTLRDYYSKKILFKSELPKLSGISWNRFEALLYFLHISDDENCPPGDRSYKIAPLGGYTYALKIYGGGGVQTSKKPLATRVVMELMEPLLNTGRTLSTDSFNTSVDLAHELKNRRTHLVGTLRQNRKLKPKAVTNAKLKRGEMKVHKISTNDVVRKWKDKRDVLFLTTRAVPEMVEAPTKRDSVLKPSTIVDS
nr:unnamed protein product [Callosobruchus chinensis]